MRCSCASLSVGSLKLGTERDTCCKIRASAHTLTPHADSQLVNISEHTLSARRQSQCPGRDGLRGEAGLDGLESTQLNSFGEMRGTDKKEKDAFPPEKELLV